MKNLIQNEPVVTAAVTALVVAIVGLAIAFGGAVTEEQGDLIAGAVPPIMAVVFLIARSFTTPSAAVVEHEKDGVVLAGEANELPTDTEIRPAGSLGTEAEAVEHETV